MSSWLQPNLTPLPELSVHHPLPCQLAIKCKRVSIWADSNPTEQWILQFHEACTRSYLSPGNFPQILSHTTFFQNIPPNPLFPSLFPLPHRVQTTSPTGWIHHSSLILFHLASFFLIWFHNLKPFVSTCHIPTSVAISPLSPYTQLYLHSTSSSPGCTSPTRLFILGVSPLLCPDAGSWPKILTFNCLQKCYFVIHWVCPATCFLLLSQFHCVQLFLIASECCQTGSRISANVFDKPGE